MNKSKNFQTIEINNIFKCFYIYYCPLAYAKINQENNCRFCSACLIYLVLFKDFINISSLTYVVILYLVFSFSLSFPLRFICHPRLCVWPALSWIIKYLYLIYYFDTNISYCQNFIGYKHSLVKTFLSMKKPLQKFGNNRLLKWNLLKTVIQWLINF